MTRGRTTKQLSEPRFVGYARVSTLDQQTDRQVEALTKAGAIEVFQEKESGMKKGRPALRKAIEFLRTGETLLVYELDRLSRSPADLMNIHEELKNKGCFIRCIQESIDTSTEHGELFLMFSAIWANIDYKARRRRQLEGLEQARKQGKHIGRRATQSNKAAKAKSMYESGYSVSGICEMLELKRSTFYHYRRKDNWNHEERQRHIDENGGLLLDTNTPKNPGRPKPEAKRS